MKSTPLWLEGVQPGWQHSRLLPAGELQLAQQRASIDGLKAGSRE